MKRRRRFLQTLAGSLLAVLSPARAQAPERLFRIGYLNPATAQDPGHAFAVLRSALAGLGYVNGRNIAYEERWADGKLAKLDGFAAELVASRVDLIVAVSPSAIRAAQKATTTLPIVMAFSGDDPVKSGFVASLAHPGTNITGMTALTSAVAPKWIELLLDAVPSAKRVAVLRSPDRADHDDHVEIIRAAAQRYQVQIHTVSAKDLGQYPAAFDEMSRQKDQAVIILSGPEFAQNLGPLASLALTHRLPSLWQYREFAVAGGLLAYGPDIQDLSAAAAVFVDKILKGAKPADLPVQQPTKFVLAINLKTAGVLGLAIPRDLMVRADDVIR